MYWLELSMPWKIEATETISRSLYSLTNAVSNNIQIFFTHIWPLLLNHQFVIYQFYEWSWFSVIFIHEKCKIHPTTFLSFHSIKSDGELLYFCQRSQPHSIKQGTKILCRDFGLEGKLKISKHEIKVISLREQSLS